MNLLTVFSTGANSIFPIVLLTYFGLLLRQRGFLSEEFVRMGNKLCFQYLLPAKLFVSAYDIEKFTDIPWTLVFFCMILLLLIFCLGFLTAPLATGDPRRKGVLLQSTFRSNSAIIGISLAGILGGELAAAFSAIVTAVCVPLLNVLAVLSLTIYLHPQGETGSLKRVARNVAKNPLILAILLGFGCILIRSVQQRLFGRAVFSLRGNLPFLYSALAQLGSIATPFALVMLGGQFRFSAAGDMRREIVVGVLWRNVIAPAICLGAVYLVSTYTGLFTCTSTEYPALIALFATPAAVSSAVMASQMDNDGQLATQIVVWSSIASIVTVFAVICILLWTGLMLP